MSLKRVGILGGMGPEATLLIMRKVLEAVKANDDADHIPLIVDQNPQVPSRIAYLLEGGSVDPAPVLAEMSQRLQAAGAQALAMPCNTAHHFAPAIVDAVDVSFLNMVELSVAHAASLTPTEGKVGILASPAVRKVGLFEPALAAHGLSAAYPSDEDALLSAIRRVKANGPNPISHAALSDASQELLDQGVNVQMIACTEFSLIADAAAPGAQAFDTLDQLVRAIVAFSMGSTA